MLSSLREAAARADFAFIALALGAYVVSVPLVAWRWRTMLCGVTGRRAPLGSLVLATLASSFVNNMTPAARLGGEACRVIALVRLRLATMPQAAAAAAYERLTEVPAVAALAVAALFVVGRMSFGAFHRLSPPGTFASWIIAVALVLGMTGGALYAIFGREGRVAPIRVGARGWARIRARWRGFASIRVTPSALIATALMSAAIWALDVVRLRLAAAAFNAPIGLSQTAALAAIAIVAGWVPTVGGLGAIEGGLIAGLVGFGVPPADAIAITAVERAISYGVGSVAGFLSISLLGGRSLWKAVRAGVAVPEGATT